jgi:hypothetical protein
MCAMAAAAGILIGAPAAQADDLSQSREHASGDVPTLRFEGTFTVGPGGNLVAGNCFTGGPNSTATFGIEPRDCGVERAVYNASGGAFRANSQLHAYLGNQINLRGGTVYLGGGIFEGNNIAADKIVILGDAILVGNNNFDGEVVVENPDSVAGEVYVDRVLREDVNYTHARLYEYQRTAAWFLSEANFNRLDNEGELGGSPPDGRVGLHNVVAAATGNDLHAEYARHLANTDFALFSAIETVNGPRDPEEGTRSIRREDFQRFHDQIVECRREMERALPSGNGAALAAAFNCARRNASESMRFDDVSDRLSDIMR